MFKVSHEETEISDKIKTLYSGDLRFEINFTNPLFYETAVINTNLHKRRRKRVERFQQSFLFRLWERNSIYLRHGFQGKFTLKKPQESHAQFPETTIILPCI